MKNILILIITISSFTTTAQNDPGLFFDVNVGARFSGAHSDQVKQNPSYHLDGAMGYMFSELVGIRGTLGFDPFKTMTLDSDSITDRSYMLSATLECVFSLSQWAEFGTDVFDMNFHAGFGFSSHINPHWKKAQLAQDGFAFSDPALKGNDDMVNLIFGLTPKFHLSENISLQLDLSYIMLLKKDYTNDRDNNVIHEGMDGIVNARFGLSYRL